METFFKFIFTVLTIRVMGFRNEHVTLLGQHGNAFATLRKWLDNHLKKNRLFPTT